jgi:hypothetical protein
VTALPNGKKYGFFTKKTEANPIKEFSMKEN